MRNRRGATIIDLVIAFTVVLAPIILVAALIILRRFLQ